MKSCTLENLPINDQNLIPLKSLSPSTCKIKSSYFNFPEQILTIAETQFIVEHIWISLFWFSLKRLVGSNLKPLSRHLLLVWLSWSTLKLISFQVFHSGTNESLSQRKCLYVCVFRIVILFHIYKKFHNCSATLSTVQNWGGWIKWPLFFLKKDSKIKGKMTLMIPLDLLQHLSK